MLIFVRKTNNITLLNKKLIMQKVIGGAYEDNSPFYFASVVFSILQNIHARHK